jgi:hypothetical protein
MKFQVEITSIGKDQARAVRALRTVGKMSLKRALDVHWFARHMSRVTVVAGIEKEVADHIGATLQDGGVCCEIVPSSVRTPMTCDPGANKLYRWGVLSLFRTSKGVEQGYSKD